MFKSLILILSTAVCFAGMSATAIACACCAEPGTREITRSRPDAYYLGLLGEMKFTAATQLYMTEAGFDSIKGLTEIAKDSEGGKDVTFSLVESFLNRSWRFTVKTNTTRTGTLTLPLVMVRYKIDIHDTPPNEETILYKELLFTGSVVTGSGIFRTADIKPVNFTLVFQGRGNECDNASDFTHWRLELNGARAKYAFFGKMNS